MKGEVKKKGGDIITYSIRHPPFICLSFVCSNSVYQRTQHFYTETLTLSAAKLCLRLGLRSEAAAKFCRAGSQSNRRKHEVSKGVQF